MHQSNSIVACIVYLFVFKTLPFFWKFHLKCLFEGQEKYSLSIIFTWLNTAVFITLAPKIDALTIQI